MYRLQWQVLSPPSIPLSNPPAARLILPKRPVRPGEDLVRFPHGGALEPLPDQRRGRATRYRALPARIRACGTTAHRPACCPRLPGTEAGTGSTRRCSLFGPLPFLHTVRRLSVAFQHPRCGEHHMTREQDGSPNLALCDSFIRNSTPVCPDAIQAESPAPRGAGFSPPASPATGRQPSEGNCGR